MTLAVSNIAWTAADDAAAYAMLRGLGVTALELAPTRFWPDLAAVTESEARERAGEIAKQGYTVCAFQALLFGKPELHLFGADNGRALIDYTKQVCTLASWMGAKALVFGSPKNRLRGDLTASEAFNRAKAAFREIGDHAAANNVVLCLEPNPTAYGADFLTTAPEAMALVRAIDSPGIAMNFDMGEIILNSEDAAQMVAEALPVIGHFHVSEPMLEPFDAARNEHIQAAAALRALNYTGVVSVEMKTPAAGLPVVESAVAAIKKTYGL